MFRNVFSGCVSDRSSQTEVLRSQKLKFGASLSSALKHGYLPGPLVDILVYIAQDGVGTADVFRRPGNPNDTRRIVKRLTEGKQVIYANYSFYTLASVVKKFLLKIPGGIFTPEGEEQLLNVLTIDDKMRQIDAVHNYIETLAPAHQHLLALLFGTWFRIVTYQEENCMNMSVEALSRSVAGSMFHTCAEDPAKVEKASRIMHFLIDNFGVERMFGQENIRFFAETTHTGIHIRELYRYSYCRDSQLIPSVRPDVIEVTRLEGDEEDDGLGREREFSESPQPSPSMMRCSDVSGEADDQDVSQLINMSTISAPEVSLVPSPDVSKRPKSLEDNLNEVRSHYQNRCLSRFNSVKRKQLERLRQRSDWFLSPTERERNNSRKGRGEGSLSMFAGSRQSGQQCGPGGNGCKASGCGNGSNGGNNNANTGNNNNNNNNNSNNHHNGSSRALQQKNSGNSVVTKASSEGAVLDVFSDGDSVFTDNTSRSESPASEPVWSHAMKVHSRDIIHSDTIAELVPEMSLLGSSGADISIHSRDNISSHYNIDLSPSPSGRSRTTEEGVAEEHEGKGDNDEDDEENTTPTGVQEGEEESTLVLPSHGDHHQHSAGEETSSKSDVTEKDSLDDLHSKVTCSDKVEAEATDARPKPQTSSETDVKDAARADDVEGQHTSQSAASEDQERLQVDGAQVESLRESDSEPLVKCYLVEHTYGADKKDS
ncbi:rho GTPase-activating protein 20 [Plakobranchus ocellatus]|uniref:Rho GTPase-activating protein 20 n=1 Tax=Plakobranchus ocellatus TaxID=259542 RepID=A0AAV4DD68_9GAST|nr:rho GTPase-activating protein 20 [Plakobranchus ocellatus]